MIWRVSRPFWKILDVAVQHLARRFLGHEGVAPSLVVLIAGIILVAWLAPADRVLGNLVKLVYVHGAIIQVALLTFAVAGVLGAVYLISKREVFYEWSQAAERAGLLVWVLYILTSAVTTILAWGGIAWFEPRWIFGLQVLVLAPAIHLGGSLMQNRRLLALLNVVVALVILFLLSRADLILHPPNPVGDSSSATIKLSYNLLLVLCGLVAVQVARGMYYLAYRTRALL